MLREAEESFDVFGGLALPEVRAYDTLALPAPWEAGPYRLWSLFAMLKMDAGAFVRATGLLPQLWIRIDTSGGLGQEAVSGFGQSLGELQRECERLNLDVSLRQIEYIKSRFDVASGVTWAEIGRLLKELYGRIVHELEARVFLLVTKPVQYSQPLKDWDESIKAFPSIRLDVEEAMKCYALDRPTACVFHLMRTFEVALKVLSAELGIVKHSPTWDAYLSVMPKHITDKFPDKSKAHSDKRAYYTALEGHLRAIKTAWRNPTMHEIAKLYTPEMADELIVLVRGFMREAAKELQEPP